MNTILDVLIAIYNKSYCCSGTGGSGDNPTDTPGVTPPPIGDDGTPEGEGFTDEQTYQTYKCTAATAIVDSITNLANQMQVNNLFSAQDALQKGFPTLLSILILMIGAAFSGVAGLLISIAGAIAGLAAALVVGGWSSAQIEADLTSNRDDIICDLLLAQTKEEVIAVFSAALASNTDNARVVGYLLNYGNMANWLFTNHPDIQMLPQATCPCQQPTGDCFAEDETGQLAYYPCSFVSASVPDESDCFTGSLPAFTLTSGQWNNILYEAAIDNDGIEVFIENVKGLAGRPKRFKISTTYNLPAGTYELGCRFYDVDTSTEGFGYTIEVTIVDAYGEEIVIAGKSFQGNGVTTTWRDFFTTVDNVTLDAEPQTVNFYLHCHQNCLTGNSGYGGFKTVAIGIL